MVNGKMANGQNRACRKAIHHSLFTIDYAAFAAPPAIACAAARIALTIL